MSPEMKLFISDPLTIMKDAYIALPRNLGDNEGIQEQSKQDKIIAEVESFWNTQIDYEDATIVQDPAPFIVMEDTPMSKLHFLFIMLNIS